MYTKIRAEGAEKIRRKPLFIRKPPPCYVPIWNKRGAFLSGIPLIRNQMTAAVDGKWVRSEAKRLSATQLLESNRTGDYLVSSIMRLF